MSTWHRTGDLFQFEVRRVGNLLTVRRSVISQPLLFRRTRNRILVYGPLSRGKDLSFQFFQFRFSFFHLSSASQRRTRFININHEYCLFHYSYAQYAHSIVLYFCTRLICSTCLMRNLAMFVAFVSFFCKTNRVLSLDLMASSLIFWTKRNRKRV